MTVLAKFAPPPPATIGNALALELQARTLESHRTLAAIEAATVENEEDYADATAMRTEQKLLADEWEATYRRAVGPWTTIVEAIREAFRPGKQAYAAIDSRIRAKQEAFVLAKAAAQREAEAAAQAAAKAGDSEATVVALATAQAAAAPLAGGRVALKWAVKRVIPDLLPDEWWTPDLAKIEAVAKAHRDNDNPPVIPGVVFELGAAVAVTRKVGR